MKKVIISHGDGDGICACAIAFQALDKNAEVYFIQPYNLHSLLWKLIESGEIDNVDEIFIIDLAYSEKTGKCIDEILHRTSGKCSITYIDHHKTSLEIKDKHPSVGGMININFSSSELCSYYFNKLGFLAKIGSASDKITMLSKLDTLYEEVEMLRKAIAVGGSDDDFKKGIMKKLSEGKMPSEIEEIEERANNCDEKRNMLLKDIWNNIVYEDKNIIIFNMIGINIKGHAGSIASSIAIEKKKMVFIIYGSRRTIITCRSHYSIPINVGDFLYKYLSGGGHENAGSASYNGENIKELIKKIPEWFYNEIELYEKEDKTGGKYEEM